MYIHQKNRDMVVAGEEEYRQIGASQNTEYNFFAFFKLAIPRV